MKQSPSERYLRVERKNAECIELTLDGSVLTSCEVIQQHDFLQFQFPEGLIVEIHEVDRAKARFVCDGIKGSVRSESGFLRRGIFVEVDGMPESLRNLLALPTVSDLGFDLIRALFSGVLSGGAFLPDFYDLRGDCLKSITVIRSFASRNTLAKIRLKEGVDRLPSPTDFASEFALILLLIQREHF